MSQLGKKHLTHLTGNIPPPNPDRSLQKWLSTRYNQLQQFIGDCNYVPCRKVCFPFQSSLHRCCCVLRLNATHLVWSNGQGYSAWRSTMLPAKSPNRTTIYRIGMLFDGTAELRIKRTMILGNQMRPTIC